MKETKKQGGDGMEWGEEQREDKKGKELVSELQEPEAKVDPTVPSDTTGLWLQLEVGWVVGGGEGAKPRDTTREVGETRLEEEVVMKMGRVMKKTEKTGE